MEPMATIDSSLQVDVNYTAGNIVKVNFKDNSRLLLSDTVVYKNDAVFLFQNHPENDQLSSDSTVRIIGKISDTVRTFIFGKHHDQYRLFFVETPLNDSVFNVGFVYSADIPGVDINEKLIDALTTFRQYVRFYDYAQEITFRYEKKYMYYKIVENCGDWKSENFPDTLRDVYGSIYLDRYRIEMKN